MKKTSWCPWTWTWWSRGKWENERNFLHSIFFNFLFLRAQKCKLEGVKHELKIGIFGCIACEDGVKHSQNLLPSHSWHSGKKGMPNQPNWKTNRNPSYWHLTRHGGFLKEFDMCLYTSHYLKMAKKYLIWILHAKILVSKMKDLKHQQHLNKI